MSSLQQVLLPGPTPTHSLRLSVRARVRHGLRRPHNWIQLGRFAAVGALGYAVNLLVFALCVQGLAIDYRLAAPAAWFVSVINNYWWNRRWAFTRLGAQGLWQVLRFMVVSALAFGLTYLMLIALVSGAGVAKIAAQSIAIAGATPVNFIGQKLWTFAAPTAHGRRTGPRR